MNVILNLTIKRRWFDMIALGEKREKDGGVPKHCELAWAQMPYEEGGAK